MKICLDAGHGGSDSGAVGNGFLEKNLNLELALKIGEILKDNGIEVIYTRTTDTTLSLQQRCNICNSAKPDFYISVHFNAHNGQAKGIETFCYAKGSKGEQLAKKVQNALLDALNLVNRGVKTANFYVLRNTNAPAILFETCFIDNKADMDTYIIKKDTVARAVAKAILEQLGVQEKQVQSPATQKKEEIIYRVVAGSFADLNNAKLLEQKLKSAGFSAFITQK